jgi:DNA-binding MarR family transcriptional regulator
MFMNRLDQSAAPKSRKTAPRFTDTQGQYLAFIYTYALLNRQPPAETDFVRFFRVTPPSVHQMIVQLERLGLIRRIPRQARSIELLVSPGDLPQLQPIKTAVARY